MRIRIQLITVTRIRIQILIFILCGSGFLSDEDLEADSGYQNDADPDPKHWDKHRKKLRYKINGRSERAATILGKETTAAKKVFIVYIIKYTDKERDNTQRLWNMQ
jgi:hypothetical protein